MSSHPQNNSGPTGVIPLPSDPIPLFEQNSVTRERIFMELQALRSAFLQRPTVEGLEAFAAKKGEFGTLCEEMIGLYRAFNRDHLAYIKAKKRAAAIVEKRRLQEFHRALDGMDPAEAEAARRAERERALRIQKVHEDRAAELEAKIAREKARIREKYSQYCS